MTGSIPTIVTVGVALAGAGLFTRTHVRRRWGGVTGSTRPGSCGSTPQATLPAGLAFARAASAAEATSVGRLGWPAVNL